MKQKHVEIQADEGEDLIQCEHGGCSKSILASIDYVQNKRLYVVSVKIIVSYFRNSCN